MGWAAVQCLPSHVQKDICAVQWEWEKEIGILSPLVNLPPGKDNVYNHLCAYLNLIMMERL